MKTAQRLSKNAPIVVYPKDELHIDHIPVRFSTNEGETWTDFKFSDREVYVYQLLTEPGEKSTIFTIFGSYANQRHSWLILQVNTSDVLGMFHSEKEVERGVESSYVGDSQLLPKTAYNSYL